MKYELQYLIIQRVKKGGPVSTEFKSKSSLLGTLAFSPSRVVTCVHEYL